MYQEPPHKTIYTESNRRENVEESGNHWCNVGEGQRREGRGNFLNRPPTEQALRARIYKWNFMKLKIICSEKVIVNRTNH